MAKEKNNFDSSMQRFFDFMIQEHNVILIHSQIFEIVHEVEILKKKLGQ